MNQPKLLRTMLLDPAYPGIELRYFLVRADYQGEGRKPYVSYGIQIVLGTHDRVLESGMVADITCSLEKAVDLIDLLAENTVTPATLKDIIDDWLGTEDCTAAPRSLTPTEAVRPGIAAAG